MTLEEYLFDKEAIDEIVRIGEAYPISLNEIAQIARVAAIMNTERGPHYVEKLLANDYKRYHNLGEL